MGRVENIVVTVLIVIFYPLVPTLQGFLNRPKHAKDEQGNYGCGGC